MANHSATNSGAVQLSDAGYDGLRVAVEKVFPALGVLYAALAFFWGWGYTVEVSGTIAAVAVFGGVLLTLSRRGYEPPKDTPPGGYDGKVVEDVTEEGLPILRVELNSTATADILNKDRIVIQGYDAAA